MAAPFAYKNMTATDIANQALGRLGSFRITSLNEDSAEARHCNEFFVSTRRSLLREFDFNFSEAWTTLSQVDGASGFGFSYAYAQPADYLRAIEFNGVKAGIKQYSWKYAGGRIYTDLNTAASATLHYVRDVTDCTLWDDDFCVAFSWYLAAAICPAIKQDPKMAMGLLQAGQAFLSDAKGADTQEDGLKVIKGTEFSVYQQARAGRYSGSPNFLLADWGPPQ